MTALQDAATDAVSAGASVVTLLRRRAVVLRTALGLVVGCLLAGFLLGTAGQVSTVTEVGGQRSVLDLWTHNTQVAAGALTGVVSAGLGTLVTTVPAWLLTGVQLAAAVRELGVATAAQGVVPHLVPEVLGFSAAVAIGLAPLHEMYRLLLGPAQRPARQLRLLLLDTSVGLGAAALLLMLGAVIEVHVSGAWLMT